MSALVPQGRFPLRTFIMSSQIAAALPFVAPAISKSAKWTAILVALLTCRSWPFIWHVRLFFPIIKLLVNSWIFKFILLFRSRRGKEAMKRARNAKLSRVGKNPFDGSSTYKTWCGFDDSDYNLHLSNSAYPKILDMGRMKAAWEYFPAYLRSGGMLVLGGTHFEFIREIPMLTRYEARLSLVCWDERWIYLVARFVTFPKEKKARNDQNGAYTPMSQLNPLKEHDGGHSPLRIPCDGYSDLSPNNQSYTIADPPPHWARVQEITKGGDPAALRKYLKSWKTLPENERWWENVFTGPVEAQRVANLTFIQGIMSGMQGARSAIPTK
ncbi:hypothetical protein C8J57DRAFT_1723985 [Mycena rebaudengoi]|nr:hypothetical protein C8J57DRAFT_1723985 [Mycena rebaudengoi]